MLGICHEETGGVFGVVMVLLLCMLCRFLERAELWEMGQGVGGGVGRC